MITVIQYANDNSRDISGWITALNREEARQKLVSAGRNDIAEHPIIESPPGQYSYDDLPNVVALIDHERDEQQDVVEIYNRCHDVINSIDQYNNNVGDLKLLGETSAAVNRLRDLFI